MTKEDFLFLIGDEPGTDEAFVDSFLMNRTPPTPEEVTSTGNPLLIRTSEAQNADATLIFFVPQQAGEGSPSPENIRPISGYSDLTLTVNGTDTTINLGGTYYGGTVDLENGTLTVTHTAETYDGTDASWDINITGNGYFIPIRDGSGYDGEKPLICSCLYGMNAGSSFNMPQNTIRINTGKKNLLVKVDTATDFQTVDDWKQFLQSNPMTVLFPLAEPITYTLTPQTVALLKGNNRLSTDGEKITITYTGYPIIIPTLAEGRLTLNENMGFRDQKGTDDVLSPE